MSDSETAGMATPETNEWFLKEAERALVQGFFGSIAFSVENGWIARLKIERSVKRAPAPARDPADAAKNTARLLKMRSMITPGFFGKITLSAANGLLDRYEIQQVFKFR